MHIIKADIKTFKEYQSQLLEIYLEAGTSPPMEQYLDKDEETRYLIGIFKKRGYGYFAINKGKLIGFMLAGPLRNDSLLPESISGRYPVERCLYIDEMHLHKDYRGKGIGSKMMRRFIKEADRKNKYLFIRAWMSNPRAINFYKKHGFALSEIIEQKKIRKDRSGTFMIKKQYLVQELK